VHQVHRHAVLDQEHEGRPQDELHQRMTVGAVAPAPERAHGPVLIDSEGVDAAGDAAVQVA
jgi:hypothetical protein